MLIVAGAGALVVDKKRRDGSGDEGIGADADEEVGDTSNLLREVAATYISVPNRTYRRKRKIQCCQIQLHLIILFKVIFDYPPLICLMLSNEYPNAAKYV